MDRIAFLCHPYHRGGVTRWMTDAAGEWARQGKKVFFVTVKPRKPFFAAGHSETIVELLQHLQRPVEVITMEVGAEFEFGIPEHRVRVYQLLIGRSVPMGTPIILSDDADVWAAACGMYVSYPVVGVLHGDEPHYYQLAVKYKHSVDLFACVSKRVFNNLKVFLPELTPPVAVIPCGINLPDFNPVITSNTILSLVYVGRITEYQKRVSDLYKLAIELRARNVTFKLTFIGNGGDDRDRLEKKFQDAGFGKMVTFSGWMSKDSVQKVMAASDILVLTSDFEGTPIAMMEALANGCGFVGTRVSGIEDYEFAAGATNCFRVFEVGDIEAGVISILNIAAISPKNRIEAARQIAEQYFTLEKCLDTYEQQIGGILRSTFVNIPKPISAFLKVKSLLIAIARRVKLTMNRVSQNDTSSLK